MILTSIIHLVEIETKNVREKKITFLTKTVFTRSGEIKLGHSGNKCLI